MAVATARTIPGRGSAQTGESPRSNSFHVPRAAIVLSLVGMVCMVYLFQVNSLATIGYDIQRLQLERDAWRFRNEQLRFELAKARSLTWVESQAISHLGMQKIDKPQFIRVDPPNAALIAAIQELGPATEPIRSSAIALGTSSSYSDQRVRGSSGAGR